MLVLFDHRCSECSKVFEELVERDGPKTANCPDCGGLADRQLGSLRMDPKLGVDPSYPTMADKWVKRRLQHQRIEEKRKREHGD